MAAFQDYGAVSFLIKTDGKEAFRSRVIRRGNLARYEVGATGVKMLELRAEYLAQGVRELGRPAGYNLFGRFSRKYIFLTSPRIC